MGYLINFNRTADSEKNLRFWWTNYIDINDYKYSFKIHVKNESRFNSISIEKIAENSILMQGNNITVISKDNIKWEKIMDLPDEIIYLTRQISMIDFNLYNQMNHFTIDFKLMNITYSYNTQININISILENSIIKFKEIIDSDCSEKDIHTWIESNSLIFGNLFKFKGKEKIKLFNDRTSKFDFTFNTIFQKSTCILELKKANKDIEIIKYDKNHDNWYWSSDASKGIAQLAKYLQIANENPYEGDNTKYRKYLYTTGILLIGRKNDIWIDEELDWQLELLNKNLINIKVITYDHLSEYLDEYLCNLKMMKG